MTNDVTRKISGEFANSKLTLENDSDGTKSVGKISCPDSISTFAATPLTEEKISQLYVNLPVDLILNGSFGLLKPGKIPCNSNGIEINGFANGKTFDEVAVPNKKAICISLVLSDSNDEFCVIDIDHCIVDGKIDPDNKNYEIIKSVVTGIGSYSEISMSGTGLHIYVGMSEGKPEECTRTRNNVFEFYTRKRVIGMTGHRLSETPSHIRYLSKNQLRDIYVKMGLNDTTTVSGNRTKGSVHTTVDFENVSMDGLKENLLSMVSSIECKNGYRGLSDAKSFGEIMDRLEKGSKTSKLLEGNWKELGYPSKSEGDLALAYYAAVQSNCDPDMIVSVMNQSKLFDYDYNGKEKWDRKDYLSRTIGKAIIKVCSENPDILQYVKDREMNKERNSMIRQREPFEEYDEIDFNYDLDGNRIDFDDNDKTAESLCSKEELPESRCNNTQI